MYPLPRNREINFQPESHANYSGAKSRGESLRSIDLRRLRHLSLQYLTSAQTFSHFFRHLNGLPQTTQTFSGSLDFLWPMDT